MAKDNGKKSKTFRSKEQIAFEHGRQLMNYCVGAGKWDWVEQLTPIIKDLAPSDQADPQKELAVDPQ